jgi:hypothetical protein
VDCVGDVSHATPGLVDLAERHFAAKCAHDLDAFVSFYSERALTYGDATLGWVFLDQGSFRAVLEKYMPNWGEGVSCSTRLLGNERSAVVAVRDSP